MSAEVETRRSHVSTEPSHPPYTIIVCFEDAQRHQFLMVRHRRRGWELPGGKMEPGEPATTAAMREFEEETGHQLLEVHLVLEQARPNGRCFVVTGRWGPPLVGYKRTSKEVIRELRFVARLGDVTPLAFPNDPYEEIEEALRRSLR